VSRAFTPRSIDALHDPLKARAEKIIADAVANGSGDFVTEVAAELPLQAIADLLGVPQEDRRKLFEWSNQLLSYDDPEIEGDQMVAFAEILGYSMGMAVERRADPRDDIVTRLVSADVDGRGLTDDEFGFFMILLAVAGNETTRNAITWGMHAFLQNPDQWELFKRERPDSAVDEIIRWATPVTIFQRTALNDVLVGEQEVRKGDRVGLLYASANYDDDVFEDPFRFDITRTHNPHVAFGGHGAHYCIGANLARLEVKLIFNALADAGVSVSQLAEPRKLRSAWINGVKELQVSYT
jgi:cholest-4-en-3-one 26-monooxygenase